MEINVENMIGWSLIIAMGIFVITVIYLYIIAIYGIYFEIRLGRTDRMNYVKAIAVSLIIAVLVAVFLGLSFMLTYHVVSWVGGLFR